MVYSKIKNKKNDTKKISKDNELEIQKNPIYDEGDDFIWQDIFKNNGVIEDFDDARLNALKLIRENSDNFEKLSHRLRDDEDIVLEAINKNPWLISHASTRLRDNKDIVLKAFEKEVLVYQLASKRLQEEDKELLELLEKSLRDSWLIDDNLWWQERMKSLRYLRAKEEKDFMEKSITKSNIKNRKNKF